jgi:3-hydroxyisobutyrate dehydrogenase
MAPAEMEAVNVAFLGLGVMGYPMAGHLARAGYRVTVYNRTPAKALRWCDEYDGASAPTPAAAVAGAKLVMMCVGNDDDLRAVVLGADGALAAMPAGSILVDHTTASAEVAREIHAAAAARSVGFLDAPVSGGQAGAENGKLTIMVGGDADVFAKAEPALARYARAVTLMGGPGSGQLTKMVNQICIAGLVQALAEGINFGEKAGLDVARVLDVISKGAAQSWQMENRGTTMLADKFEFGFAVDWMRKDLALCLAEARAKGAALPVTALVDQFYARVQAQGGARWDSSSLIRVLRDTPVGGSRS